MGHAGLEDLVPSRGHDHDFIKLVVETTTGHFVPPAHLNPKAKKGKDLSWLRRLIWILKVEIELLLLSGVRVDYVWNPRDSLGILLVLSVSKSKS